MSSAFKSRDLNPTGKLPAIELGYPAIVLYSFIPGEKQSTEIPVSEGDIVLLEYSVGGWVFVRTYEGTTGYIPLDYCGDLESSQSLRLVFDHKPHSLKQVGGNPKGLKEFQIDECVTEFRSNSKSNLSNDSVNLPVKNNWIQHEKEISVQHGLDHCEDSCSRDDYIRGLQDFKLKHTLKWNNLRNVNTRLKKGVVRDSQATQGDGKENKQTQKLSSCEICSEFLSLFVFGVQNLAITDKEKADLKSRKLLKLLEKATQEGLNSIPNVDIFTRHNQSYNKGIRENCIKNSNDPCNEKEPEFGINCSRCQILKDFVKSSQKYSMTDLYVTIRDLHIHAMSDSDSDSDNDTENNVGMINGTQSKSFPANDVQCWSGKNGIKKDMTSNGLPKPDIFQAKFTGHAESENVLKDKRSPEIKRSVSFQLEEKKCKSEVARNNSFSGVSNSQKLSENDDLIDFSSSDFSQKPDSTRKCESNEMADFQNNNTKSDLDALLSTEPSETRDHQSYLIPADVPKRESERSHGKFHDGITSFQIANSNPMYNGMNELENGVNVPGEYDRSSSISPKHLTPKINGIQSILHPKFSQFSPRSLEERSNSLSTHTGNSLKENEICDLISTSKTSNAVEADMTSNKHSHDSDFNDTQRGLVLRKNPHEFTSSTLKSHYFSSPKPSLSHPSVSLCTFQSTTEKHGNSLSISSQNETNKTEKSDFRHLKNTSANELEKSGHTTVPVIRTQRPSDSDSGSDKRRIIARRFQLHRNQTEHGNPNGSLVPKRDDKDIRKTLHDLTSVKRTTSQKNAPLRAQHSIQVQNEPKEAGTGRSVLVKRFTKQMWRAPVGSEGSDQRPFSPFGGTLPPSKIVKKKVVEVLV